MVATKIKDIIRHVIDLDIDYLETFRGYHGDYVLKITLTNREVKDTIDRYLDTIGLKHKDDYDISKRYGGSYLIYVGTKNDSIDYGLKG